MMTFRTQRDLIKEIRQTWDRICPEREYGPFEDKAVALKELDLETCSVEDIVKIFGHDDFIVFTCTECDQGDLTEILELYYECHEDSYYSKCVHLCTNCVAKMPGMFRVLTEQYVPKVDDKIVISGNSDGRVYIRLRCKIDVVSDTQIRVGFADSHAKLWFDRKDIALMYKVD